MNKLVVGAFLFTLLQPVAAFADRDWGRGNDHGRGNWGWSREERRYGDYRGYGRPYGIIGQGIRTGALTRNEVREIRDKNFYLQRKREDYWSDGHLSKRERKDLGRLYGDLRKDIRHNLNDGERRNSFWGRGWEY